MSAPVSVNIPHKLGAAEARRRVESGFGRLEAQLAAIGVTNLQKGWKGDELSFTGRAFGQGIGGRLTVFPEALRVELDLPPLLAMLAGRIQAALGRGGRLLLEKK
jgi:hypothetical protein